MRRRRDCFNEAAIRGSRRCVGAMGAGSIAYISFNEAAIRGSRRSALCERGLKPLWAASMRPRSGDRGDGDLVEAEAKREAASMRPRSGDRGDQGAEAVNAFLDAGFNEAAIRGSRRFAQRVHAPVDKGK